MTLLEFQQQPGTRRLLQALLDLSLVSHVRGTAYDSSSTGGKIESALPTGGIDRRGDREEEFRQKSVDHFVRRLQGIVDGLGRMSQARAEELRDEILQQAIDALEAWRYTPDVPGVEPERGTLAWKCKIANDPRSSRVVAGHYGTSHVTVLRYRRDYLGIRA